jgi:hypothetical protein
LPYIRYYKHIPYVPTSSSVEAQLPTHLTSPNDPGLPLALSRGDLEEPSYLLYGDYTAAQDGPMYDLGGYCLSDRDSTTSHGSTASRASTGDCQVLFSDLPAECIRNHEFEQIEKVQELLEEFGKSLYISPLASSGILIVLSRFSR